MAKSYFAILGVSPGASLDEIRSAYRRLAKEFHPDRFEGGDAPFIEIQEAYAVLSNPQERRGYEKTLARTAAQKPIEPLHGRPAEPLIPSREPTDIGPISPIRSFRTFTPSFDEIFDWFERSPHAVDPVKSGRAHQLTIEVPLTRQQAREGGKATVLVPMRGVCPVCQGAGNLWVMPCRRCSGQGTISGELPLSVSFPPGLVKDHAVVLELDRLGLHHLALIILFRPTDR